MLEKNRIVLLKDWSLTPGFWSELGSQKFSSVTKLTPPHKQSLAINCSLTKSFTEFVVR